MKQLFCSFLIVIGAIYLGESHMERLGYFFYANGIIFNILLLIEDLINRK